jgi:hypothetical protein
MKDDHSNHRASSHFTSVRILKTTLILILEYGIVSQFLLVQHQQWAVPNAILDDDSPQGFYGEQEIDDSSLSQTNAASLIQGATNNTIDVEIVNKQTTAATNISQPPQPAIPLNLIPKSELNFYDYFSDSWLITKSNFLQLNVSGMNHVEQACFQAIRRKNYYVHPTSKMFVDWTDFMVEHMSKWWGSFRIARDPDPTMFHHVIDMFDRYLLNKGDEYKNTQKQEHPKSPLHPTLAMVAFRAYQSEYPTRGPLLSSHALAATLASILPLGFGRIVVAGYEEDDATHVEAAFRLLHASMNEKEEATWNSTATTMTLDHTQLAFVRIPSQSWVKTKAYDANVPRGALTGMQLAIKGKLDERIHNTTSCAWLGTAHNASYWKFFYLTEPDTILHTKLALLPSIREGLDRGLSFFPHRLQPLPHEENLPPASKYDTKNKHVSAYYAGNYLPGDVHPFSNITVLDPWNEDDHCCDDGNIWPGRSEAFGDTSGRPCENWWWACGFSDSKQPVKNLTSSEILKLHKRLVPYPMMLLKSGIGAVFGPTNMGRRCIPSKSPCSGAELHVLRRRRRKT